MKVLITNIIILSSISSFASEVDNFKNRYVPLEDATEQINEITNTYFKWGVMRANKLWGCEEKNLYKSIRHYFRNHYFGELSKVLYSSKKFERREVPIRESIYNDFKWYDAFVPGFYAKTFEDPSASIVKVNDIQIGVDKFEHFVGSGRRYFERFHLEGRDLFDSLKIGLKAETGFMGSVTTGVMSYGDLVANFNGMRFWNHILQKDEDILGENIGPLVQCVDGQWEIIKKFDWENYVDKGFDEAINCSKFRNERLVKKVRSHLSTLDEMSAKDCLMTDGDKEELLTRYGNLSPYLINIDGISKVKKYKSFKKLWKKNNRSVYRTPRKKEVE